ncbi:hypothetical protein VTO73DRAFT_12946 [Trametes versicolor]
MSFCDSPRSLLLSPALLSESPASTPNILSPASSHSDDATVVGDELTKPKRTRTLRAASIALLTPSLLGKIRRSERQKEDRVLAVNTQITSVAELVSPLSSGLQGTAVKIAQYSTNVLFEGLPELVKVLQEVAAVHPFIALAVGAFRVAIELDLKRRENDKKINLLFMEMRDMMTALVELGDVKEPKRAGKDGKTVQERLQGLVDNIETDILDCANVCDAYAKKGMTARVLGSIRWNEKLQHYVKRFTKHRADIEFTLAIHLGINIDIANRKLDSIDSKVESVLEFLQGCTSPEEKELAMFIESRGGRDAVLKSERLLLELINQRPRANNSSTDGRWASRQSTLDLRALKEELSEEPEISISRNWGAFERKFEMQERELGRIQEIVHEENQLVIKSVTSGPHDKIRDNDLHNIWREMRWRGNVKARHFVLALRDYCLERLDKIKKNEQTFIDCDRPTNIDEHDEWTLDYISVTRLQAIIEAFDDDASGFITVGEVNAFTASKPQDWSLLHWMAYWAIGWQMTMTRYVIEIDSLLDKMFAIKKHVLPANRRSVEQYLDVIWSPITELTTGFRRIERNDVVEERFQPYVDAEENRLRDALQDIKYDIDAADILQLVTGPGRVEKFLFPLLWLLLKRDFEILRLSRNVVLHRDELWDSASSLKWVFRAVSDRCTNLENLFKQQNLDPGQQFKVFASELFRYWHDSTPLWSTERLREAHYLEKPYNDADEDAYVDPSRLLNHPAEDTANPIESSQYFETNEDQCAKGAIRSILGQWSGYVGDAGMFPSEPMMRLDMHASSSSPNMFVASGTIPIGTRFNVSGTTASPNGSRSVTYHFQLTYAARYWPRIFRGRLSDDGRELSGVWTCKGNDTEGTFLFRRLPPDSMRFWPLLADVESRKPLTLWRFALSAVQDQVRRKMLSINLLRERQAIRQRYLRAIRVGLSTQLPDEKDRQTLIHCYLFLTPSEARYYYSVYESMQSISPKHFGIKCAHCRADIYGSRTMCLDCGIRTTVDLCNRAECREATIGPDRRDDLVLPHLPSHRILKVRRVIHRHREFGKMYRAAQAALIRAEEALADADDLNSPQILHGGHSRHPSVRIRTEQLVDRELSCVGCKKRVSRPCWYCIDCDGECFVCPGCESSKISFSGGHKPIHGLVRCALPRDDMAKAADLEWSHSRIDALEAKLEVFQRDSASRFDALDGRLSGLGNHSADLEAMQVTSNQKLETLDVRLQRIESLLSAIASKL